jgi:hypothetical protein
MRSIASGAIAIGGHSYRRLAPAAAHEPAPFEAVPVKSPAISEEKKGGSS